MLTSVHKNFFTGIASFIVYLDYTTETQLLQPHETLGIK